MGTVVVGIFPNSEAVHALVGNLKSGGYDLDLLRVVSSEEVTDELIRSGIQYIYSGDAEEVSIGSGGYITSMGGTGVAGLTDLTPSRPEMLRNRTLADNLGELEISDSRLDDYLDAVDGGRSVAGYGAKADSLEKVKALFSSSGATLVEVF